jgi:hypothetical protein
MIEIRSGQGMLDRFGEELVLLVPGIGTTVEFRYERRLHLLQVATQDVGEEMVIAVPLPFIVK